MARTFYWLTGEFEGSTFLIKGGWSEEEARQKGLEELSGIDFKIVPLRTTNQATASQMMKGNILQDTKDLRKAVKRLRHKNIHRRVI